MKELLAKKYVLAASCLIVGLMLGWLMFHAPSNHSTNPESTAKEHSIWTCSMHPQIHLDKEGPCPLCGMDLIPLSDNNTSSTDSNAVHFSKDAAALAQVGTSVVVRQEPIKELHLLGKVQMDERLMQTQVAHVSGRIERLMVNFTGESVKKGQLLATIYAPNLVNAQQELIEAAKNKVVQPEIYESARERLIQMKLSSKQLDRIEKLGRVQANVELYATTSGTVISRKVNVGEYVEQGMPLFEVANLSQVWVLFDAYENDLPFLKVGDKVDFTLQAVHGRTFSANIQFIDPFIDPTTRVAKLRVELKNADGTLKPEMFANGKVRSNLQTFKDKLVIPSTSVLWTGKRSVVYVKVDSDEGFNFVLREIELGPKLGNSYVVLKGLEEAEEIVTDGAFSVDAAAQLAGKPSMLEH